MGEREGNRRSRAEGRRTAKASFNSLRLAASARPLCDCGNAIAGICIGPAGVLLPGPPREGLPRPPPPLAAPPRPPPRPARSDGWGGCEGERGCCCTLSGGMPGGHFASPSPSSPFPPPPDKIPNTPAPGRRRFGSEADREGLRSFPPIEPLNDEWGLFSTGGGAARNAIASADLSRLMHLALNSAERRLPRDRDFLRSCCGSTAPPLVICRAAGRRGGEGDSGWVGRLENIW